MINTETQKKYEELQKQFDRFKKLSEQHLAKANQYAEEMKKINESILALVNGQEGQKNG